MYYTLAWFDRWLKGEQHDRTGKEVPHPEVRGQAANASERLTAETFDSSADAFTTGAPFPRHCGNIRTRTGVGSKHALVPPTTDRGERSMR